VRLSFYLGNNMYYIGIDPSWTGKNNTAIIVCNDNLKVIQHCYSKDINEMLRAIVAYNDAIIGVDAPLIIKNQTGHRSHEIEFLRLFSPYKLGLHAVNKNRFAYFFPEKLYAELTKLGFSFENNNIYEVYPHATVMVLFNNMKVLQYKSKYRLDIQRKNLMQLINVMCKLIDCKDLFPVTIAQAKKKELKKYEDLIDAVICAYTVYYCKHNACIQFGDSNCGKLIVPKIMIHT